MAQVPWIDQSATARSSNVESLRLMNGYAEIVQSKQGKSTVAVYGSPGLLRFLTLPGAGPVRALYTASNGRCFAVQGNQCYEIFSGGTSTLRGSLNTSAGPVSIKDNGVHLVLIDNPNGYALTFATEAFAQITDPDFTNKGATRVDFLDNYLLFVEPSSQEFFWTDLLNITVNPLNIAQAEGAPDGLVSLLVIRREAWLFGSTRTEVWVTSGDGDNPFVRLESGFIQQGCAARHSPARVGESVCWLSQDEQGHAMVVQAAGFQVQPISTHAVTHAMQSYGTINDAIGWAQQQEGHVFYWLSFPIAGATWCYDLSTGLWAERGYLDPLTGVVGRHRASCHTFAFGKHLVGDYADGRIYELSLTTYSDDGAAMLFEATLPPLFDGNALKRVRHDHVQFDLESGVGLSGGAIPGTDPQITLGISDDGGHTWSPEIAQTLGKIGETQATVQWYQLGSSYDRRYRIRISDPVRRVIVGAYTDITVLG